MELTDENLNRLQELIEKADQLISELSELAEDENDLMNDNNFAKDIFDALDLMYDNLKKLEEKQIDYESFQDYIEEEEK